ncbi:LysR family transcriptional regulator [Streptomyces lydicus]|nr:LysR family transcriptional regulator [Streptomyces lydicus]
MELRQVRYFVAVAEELHFGRAAARLHIVQPTVSQQIRRLEREFGLELFDRTTRTVTLTAAGQTFLTHAQALLRAERAATEAMAALQAEQESTLRVGTTVGLGLRLDALLTALTERAPQLMVELVSADRATRLQQVRDGELDAAFIRGPDHSPGLELLPLWTDVLVAALPAGHPLAAGPCVALADLAGLPLRIAPREAHPSWSTPSCTPAARRASTRSWAPRSPPTRTPWPPSPPAGRAGRSTSRPRPRSSPRPASPSAPSPTPPPPSRPIWPYAPARRPAGWPLSWTPVTPWNERSHPGACGRRARACCERGSRA